MINFRQSLYSEEHDFKQQNAHISNTAPAADISGMEMRLKSVLVKDNNTPAIFPFPGYAKVYFLSLVAVNLPGSLQLQLKGFEKVENEDALNVDKSIFSWKKERPGDAAPNQVHVFTSVIKSKQPLRDAASVLSEVQRDSSYKLLAGTLENLLKSTTPLADISNLMFNLAGVAGKYLGKVNEKPLLSWLQSFTSINAEEIVLGRTEKTAANQYASCNLSLVIKDKIRMEEEALLERTDRKSTIGGQGQFAY